MGSGYPQLIRSGEPLPAPAFRRVLRSAAEAEALIAEAKAFEAAGAFSVVLEGVAIETAAEVTKAIAIPTIGIGSGPHCSGQVLVIYDVLGFNPDFTPSFLKRFADGHAFVTDAVQRYLEEVRSGAFPAEAHGVHRKEP